SGAFWFSRKLGFRPGRADLVKLVEREEKRIADDPKYKTPARTLKRLAEGHAFYELPQTQVGAWDRFSTRNIGLRVNRKMAGEFGGDPERFRSATAAKLARILKMRVPAESDAAHAAFYDFALLASLIPKVSSWSRSEKKLLRDIIQAKAGVDEMGYLRLLQNHSLLRRAMLKLGSRD
ncbi:MAG TPA: hypothetical protein VLL05_15755, partial [Terriglobales bacterium]|nr:hypothetical protein [Terriglobales bacterium]